VGYQHGATWNVDAAPAGFSSLYRDCVGKTSADESDWVYMKLNVVDAQKVQTECCI
jgi:hypothetical protein